MLAYKRVSLPILQNIPFRPWRGATKTSSFGALGRLLRKRTHPDFNTTKDEEHTKKQSNILGFNNKLVWEKITWCDLILNSCSSLTPSKFSIAPENRPPQ